MSNLQHLHRHAWHALDDFVQLRKRRRKQRRDELWHSISHHLRHIVYRSGLELPHRDRKYVRRTDAHR